MKPEDIDTVRSIYDAFARRDLDTIRAALAEDVLIEQPETLPWGGRYNGHDGFNTFLAALLRRVQPQLETSELFQSGEQIIHIGRSRGKVVANDHDYDIPEVHLWSFHEGKVSSFTVHLDTDVLTAALAAAA